jgi:hypothetical protein
MTTPVSTHSTYLVEVKERVPVTGNEHTWETRITQFFIPAANIGEARTAVRDRGYKDYQIEVVGNVAECDTAVATLGAEIRRSEEETKKLRELRGIWAARKRLIVKNSPEVTP